MDVAHVIRSTSNPASAPARVGMHFINTVSKDTWLSVGTSGVEDWLFVGESAWGSITGTIADQTDLINYISTQISTALTSAVIYKGGYNTTTNSPDLTTAPNALVAGSAYVVTVAGTFLGTDLEIGDMLFAEIDSPSLITDWTIVQTNLTAATIKSQYESNANTNAYTDAEKTKLTGIEALAEVNNISDVNATDLTDSGDTTLHYHAADRNRANHTGSQAISTITNLQTTLDGIDTELEAIDSTGLAYGGEVTFATTTTFNVAAGQGHIVDHSSYPPTRTLVTWGQQLNVAATALAGGQFTRIQVNSSGVLLQTNTPENDTDRLNFIQIGILVHDDLATITNVFSAPNPDYNVVGQTRDLAESIGTIIKSGTIYSPNGANLNLNLSAGSSFIWGRAYGSNKNFPSNITTNALTALNFRRVYKNGATTYSYSALLNSIDSANYNSGTSLVSMPVNKWQIMYIYFYPEHQNTYVVYGQNVYNSKAEAVAEIGRESTTHAPRFFRAALRSFLVVKQGATDLSNLNEAVFYAGGKFGSVSPSGSAIGSVTDLQSSYSASIDPEIILDASKSNAGLSIRNATTPISGNLFEVTDNANTVKHLEVLASGVKLNTTASRVLISNASGIVESSNITTAALNFLDATSSIQTQLNSKQATITGAATTIVSSNLTASRALASDASGKVAVATTTLAELNFVNGVTSAIQAQLNAKEPTITAGTSLQYRRGDKTWQTLNTSVVPEGTNLYYTEAKVSANTSVAANTTHRGLTNNPHAVTAAQVGAYTIGATDTLLSAKVTGPASATDNAIARFDAATGKLIQNSSITVSDTGVLESTNDATFSKASASALFMTLESDGSYPYFQEKNFSNVSWHGNYLAMYRARGTKASPLAIQENDSIFVYDLFGHDGTGNVRSGQLVFECDGAVSTGLVPTRFVFKTSGSLGASVAKMAIKGSGDISIGHNFITPTARLHVKGAGATSATFALKVENSTTTDLFSVRNDGYTSFQTDTKINSGGFVLNYPGKNPIAGGIFFNREGAGAEPFFVWSLAGVDQSQMRGISSGMRWTDATSVVEYMRLQSGTLSIGTASPSASAKLQVDSTTQGFLPPRMTTAQRDAIASPATGLIVYNTTTNVLNFYDGTSWGAV